MIQPWNGYKATSRISNPNKYHMGHTVPGRGPSSHLKTFCAKLPATDPPCTTPRSLPTRCAKDSRTAACRELIEMGVIDILQTDINHVGGITGLWKVGALASFSNVSMAPHACEGPIGGLATIHVDAAMPNFLIQEICGGVQPSRQDKIWEEWLGFPAMRMVDGRFPLSNKPGLGFELSEGSLAKYPFGGTKPMARVFHEDGSVAEW